MRLIQAFIAIVLSVQSFGQDVMYDICPIKNSEEIPKSIVFDTVGNKVELKEYIGRRPAVVVFYRGGWCPYCTRHLSALHEIKNEIKDLGFELIAITPDSFNRLDSSIVRGSVDYTLFSDKDINAITNFGIGWNVSEKLYEKYKNQYGMDVEWWSGEKHHVLPVPAVFIIKDGEIQYQYVNPDYSKRLSPDVLLTLIKSIN